MATTLSDDRPINTAAMIGLDWGTTSLRGFLIGQDGNVLAHREEPLGISTLTSGKFAAAYRQITAGWPRESVPSIACGMIGSRQGWYEVPYLACPAGTADLASALHQLNVDDLSLAIAPGLSYRDERDTYDVIRGEETQILGAYDPANGSRQLFVLPGTHSKWVMVNDGVITWFATFMTGELFSLLITQSILGRLCEGDRFSSSGFDLGVDCARSEQPGGLEKRLFSGRTAGLFGQVAEPDLHSYISGLLIGSEIRAALECTDVHGPLRLVGNATLVNRYESAVRRFGLSYLREDSDAAAVGLWRLAQQR